ncbi:hypothetical protein SLEP1_g52212 [Rubroshorea leprosula]|uniref:GDSL esterase/lipase EXL3 n=1 Tax=Rubroshorea leprosula TaxID=152421 RepID=A0AAV5M797_9ROSI|nr:hypothetical protein SLEP1_g52212 [Rubroshorea leprosula]
MMFLLYSSLSGALKFSVLALLFYGGCEVTVAKNATFPALIAFGDSILDSGNNNYLSTIVKCDFPPYGRDFQEGKPTGRFCNGKIPSDFSAEFYGIKELLPPYLDPNLQLQDLLTGVSFASGGAGYDPLTAKIDSVLSLSDQLELFKKYKEKIKSALGDEQTVTFLSEALFLICCGSNDIANTYFSTSRRSTHYDIDSYTDLAVNYASQFFQELYGLGARRVLVVELPPIGCVPLQRTLGGGLTRGCANKLNHAALLYNSKLSAQMDSLKNSLPGFKIVYADVYNPLLSIIQNAKQYGFEEVNKGCCGTGNIEAGILCNHLSDEQSCTDASKFVFWDSYHPSEKAYEILTTMILNQHTKELL